jgi:hypothetical protein
VDGDVPQYIIDGDSRSAFLFVKPGKTYGGISVAIDQKPSFTIDMKTVRDMTYLLYRHRDYNNSTTPLRASRASFYGKNSEKESFQPVFENFELSTSETEIRIDLPEKVSYRYMKFVMEGWDTSSGSTIQTSEFNVGNKVLIDLETSVLSNRISQNPARVFPNPVIAGESFNIQLNENFKNAKVGIYTTTGIRISEKEATDKNLQMSLSQPGIFFIKILKDQQSYTLKIIVRQ